MLKKDNFSTLVLFSFLNIINYILVYSNLTLYHFLVYLSLLLEKILNWNKLLLTKFKLWKKKLQTHKFLEVLLQLSQMGFPQDEIKGVLLLTSGEESLNRDKALQTLMDKKRWQEPSWQIWKLLLTLDSQKKKQFLSINMKHAYCFLIFLLVRLSEFCFLKQLSFL